MGCATSSKGAIGLKGSGAKKWLKIEDVAASVQTFPRSDGCKGLTVIVAGMDAYGLICKLERAFHNRGMGIESGQWSTKGVLFHGTLQLYPFDDNASTKSSPNSTGAVARLHTEHSPDCIDSQPDDKLVVSRSAHALISGQLKVVIHHTMADELHGGLLALVHEFGGRITRGTLQRGSMMSVGQDASTHMDVDSFWIDIQDEKALTSKILSSPEALQEALRVARRALEEEYEKASILSSLSLPMPKDATATTTDSLLNALRLADRKALQKLMLDLPVAILEIVGKTPYEIKPSSWGHQVEGFQKYMGSGIILQRDVGPNDQAPVLQFTTLFVQKKDAVQGGRWNIAALKERQYGEFVNSIDLNHRRFTIEKVFLNSVCPAGHNIGAAASAEQLFAPVWEHGAAGLGELLRVHEVQEIKLNDVVNWNTYSLLAIALSEQDDPFGDHFKASVDEELQAAKLTRGALKTLPLLEVVLHTQLGKLILRILNLWHQKSAVCLKCVSVEVIFRAKEFERIHGESRNCMDVICKVEVDHQRTLDPDCDRPATDQQLVAVSSSRGEAALAQWMSKMNESIGSMDHGYNLGSAELRNLVGMSKPSLVSMNNAVRELQRERGRSCEAVAEDLSNDEDRADSLSRQRKVVDEAFVKILQMTSSSIIHNISTSLILLRKVVDENLASSQTWEERYKTICTKARAFNCLIGILIEWLASTCKIMPEIDDASAESIRLFCYFGEQLGRERAFVLARGGVRKDSDSDADGLRNLVSMSATRNLIGDLLKLNSRTLFRNLDKAESRVLFGDMQDQEAWFTSISQCIDAIRDLIEDLIIGGPDTWVEI